MHDIRREPDRGREPVLQFDGLLHTRKRRAKTAGTVPFQFPAELPATPIDELVHATAALDNRGRLGNKSLFRLLSWTSADRLQITVEGQLPVIRRSQSGRSLIRANGYLYLPSAVRRDCNLTAGERVLLAAAPALDVVVVYPLQAVAGALWAYRRHVWERKP
ncbi:hypothetical protein [Nocardia sp. bgisy118]|uniref:hypothetical protein n=1 Tax=Nocardia sp. bgisy118 TaxID=3413786 RepID=UPI003F4A253F